MTEMSAEKWDAILGSAWTLNHTHSDAVVRETDADDRTGCQRSTMADAHAANDTNADGIAVMSIVAVLAAVLFH